MIMIKGADARAKIREAGKRLANLFCALSQQVKPGVTTASLDTWIEKELIRLDLVSQTKGYRGYRHVSCISVNDELVHGIPSAKIILKNGDLVKIDICAAWSGYCADAARCFVVGEVSPVVHDLIAVVSQALSKGIEKACVGNRLGMISSAIQREVEQHGYGVVRDFCGHGIGAQMHEDPEIPNYGNPQEGPLLKDGMVLALEPMITQGKYQVEVIDDGWTVCTVDGSLAAHIEDTVIVSDAGPEVVTRL